MSRPASAALHSPALSQSFVLLQLAFPASFFRRSFPLSLQPQVRGSGCRALPERMRKQEDAAPYSRLSSSCSSIRSSNYSTARPYTPSLSSYRYSASSYTPSSRMSSSENAGATSSSITGRSRYSTSSTSSHTSTLPRSASTTHKNLYTSPAAARVSVSANESISTSSSSWTPSAYRGLSRYQSSTSQNAELPTTRASSIASSSERVRERPRHVEAERIETTPTTRTHMVHPTSSHIRSRSTSYRTINVAQFNQQAKERAERDEKDRQFREWIEKENARDSSSALPLIEPTPPPVAESTPQKDFRKKLTSYSSASGYSSSSYAARPTSPRPPLDLSPDGLLMSTSQSATSAPSAPPPAYKASGGPPAPPPPPPPASRSATLPRSMSTTFSTSASVAPSRFRPTAKVMPYDEDQERVCVVQSGYTGLRNIGNTCFMNAVLQMLINNIELREFFLRDHFRMEINEKNPLGFSGRLAIAFADFMRQMWSGMQKAIEPCTIKEIVAEKASQFANFAQHDAHEFLSFLLDGLHEDVNRVKNKPLTGTVESDGRHDIEVSNEAWRNHLLRNDSIFVDLFHGQLKSRVQCPNCDRVSITFDPFVYLPVPFPKRKRSNTVLFWPLDSLAKPLKITVTYSNDGTVADLLSAVAEVVGVPSRVLRAIEVFGHRIDKIYNSLYKASDIGSCDVVYVFQIHDEADCNEEVITMYALQRQLFPPNLRYMCNECGKHDGHLKACEGCYNAYFCSKDCQLSNWTNGGHRDECRRRPIGEHVGQPLVVSFPRSQLSYAHLYRTLEARSRHSVTVFQAPQYGDVNGNDGEVDPLEADSLSLPGKKRPGVGAPPSFLNPAGQMNGVAHSRSPSPRRQSVLAEPRSKNLKASPRLFDIRRLNQLSDSFGELISDSPDSIEQLQNGAFLSVNWVNMRFGKEYITVGNRSTVDIDTKRSEELSPTSKNADRRGSDAEPTLNEMLELFSETERLKPEESWYCSNCKTHVEATKKLELYRLPPILIVQLKRFVYTAFASQASMHRRSKDERHVDYPLENLDMAPFLSPNAPDQPSTIYDLTGAVCHSGSSYFGHYISLGRLPDFDGSKTKIEWRTFDDSMVTRQSASAVQSDDAYLLFYKLRSDSVTRGIFRKHYSCDPGDDPKSEGEKSDL
ncbi:unnamed protein product [Caenorhabditis auriculariae]|uniref:ubiquitinyl hydrolase 1 n=1 Tax=Caenorhabditis auriculariae TaxID=2777116 RepID=A0A8S1HSE0_9PELO|nr:unnamed protein product [Caenorhabditis auriculariae]